jgi:hypothetical protein
MNEWMNELFTIFIINFSHVKFVMLYQIKITSNFDLKSSSIESVVSYLGGQEIYFFI